VRAITTGLTALFPATALAAEPGTIAPVHIDVLAMARSADPVVQAVMGFLLLCSLASWAILVEKSLTLARIHRLTRAFLARVRAGGSITAKIEGEDVNAAPIARMWCAAKAEWQQNRITAPRPPANLAQRMSLAANIVQEEEMAQLSRYMGILATIGSTAPFIGLFGTVWGILTSFVGIAASHASNLSTVAPGIAEALLATAIGLFAAIPAVMIYNKFARDLSRVTGTLDNFQAEIARLVARELDMAG
jgi:TolQ protein